MRKLILIAAAFFLSLNIFAQTLQDAQRELDNENYFKARQILFKLINDPAANKAEVAYYLGNAMLKSDDADSAKIFYKMAYDPNTRSALGLVANGRLALIAKNKAEAKVNFDRALQTSKMKNATIYYEIGDAYFRPTVSDLAAATTNFEAAYNLDNKNTTIILALGDAYLANTDDPTMAGKAMNKYEAATEANKKLALAWIKQGRLNVMGHIYPTAIESFNKALEIDQSYPIVYKELAEAYYLTKQYDKFKTNFEKYVALSPGDMQAKVTMASLYFSNKDYEKALDESNKGLGTDPNNYVFQRIVAFSNYELKRYKDAADADAKFWANNTKKVKDIDYIYGARIASQVGDTTNAFGYFNTALANDSANCDLLGEYAKTLYTAKRYTDAVNQYNVKKTRCNTLGSLDVYYLGRAYYYLGDSINADTTFGEFIKRNPTSPDGWYWRATVNLKIGKPEEFSSFPYYAKYAELTASDPTKYKNNLTQAYDYMGIYYFEKGKDKPKSKEYFSKVLELDPADKLATEYMKQFK